MTREGPLSQRDAVRLVQDVAYSLAYAHGRGVVHRDIKPDNIMIERATGRVLVMDFGIARAITPVSEHAGLTRVGEVVGTPEYMSPEQATGDHVDGRADLYSLGLVAWYALTGRTAMAGDSTQRILVRQLTESIPSLAVERPDLPAWRKRIPRRQRHSPRLHRPPHPPTNWRSSPAPCRHSRRGCRGWRGGSEPPLVAPPATPPHARGPAPAAPRAAP
ncbi:serine/threonine-protein kinase [Gemmatimonas sp.]|uniref:serine/threonine-protein kinase n=1 Tax=Gemmatimonas sp. TaxID=1962908 RepID=UPI0022C31747|nr:serine/threonine-protein kinase [Gemmatimonas sp.]MCZ8206419.1 serine/threonine-protein kinase [Gemmatimonas sp.]